MPSSAVDNTIRAGHGREHKSASMRLHHIKHSKVALLPDLLALIEHSIPDYLCSAEKAAFTAPLFQ